MSSLSESRHPPVAHDEDELELFQALELEAESTHLAPREVARGGTAHAPRVPFEADADFYRRRERAAPASPSSPRSASEDA